MLMLTYDLPIMHRNGAAIRTAGNDILGSTQPAFDKWGPFVGTLGQAIALMQTIPAYHNSMRMNSAELARGYRRLATINSVLETVGLVGGASTAAAGAAQVIKTGSIAEGAKKVGGRMVGKGPISEALSDRYGLQTGKKLTGGLLIAGMTAKLIHESNKKQMVEFRALMQHRFQSGKATREEYIAVFGNAIDPSAIKKYSEYG